MQIQHFSPYLQCPILKLAGNRRTFLCRHFLCPDYTYL
nr:MAG TPA: hypothetical protein [Caudoviricetes sp.]